MLEGIKRIYKRFFTVKIIKPVEIPVLDNKQLANKVALIVGASGGIGSAISKKFAKAGCKVILCGTNEEKLKGICDEIGNDISKYMVFDVSNVNLFDSTIEDATRLFGKIDILVYSSGVHCKDSFGSVSESVWDNVMNINLKGMYFMCQAVSKYMIKNGINGHLLTIGSASSAKPGWTPYEISKSAVKSMTLGFADKLIKHGIVVNSIAPGPVATPMLNVDNNNLLWEGNPTGRMCSAEEIANFALILASGMGDMVVGDTFYISGGSGTICLDK